MDDEARDDGRACACTGACGVPPFRCPTHGGFVAHKAVAYGKQRALTRMDELEAAVAALPITHGYVKLETVLAAIRAAHHELELVEEMATYETVQ